MCERLTHFKEEFNTISGLSFLEANTSATSLFYTYEGLSVTLKSPGVSAAVEVGAEHLFLKSLVSTLQASKPVTYGTSWEGNSTSPSHKTQSTHPLPRKGNGARIEAGASSTCACHSESTRAGPSGKRLATRT